MNSEMKEAVEFLAEMNYYQTIELVTLITEALIKVGWLVWAFYVVRTWFRWLIKG